MLAYWILFGISSILVVFDFLELKDGQKNTFLFLMGIALVLFAGLRGEIDNDYLNYESIYRSIAATDFKSLIIIENLKEPFLDVEPGYRILNKLVYFIFSNSQFVFLFSALISVGVNLLCFKRMSPYPLLSVLLYLSHTYLLRDMMQIRAGIAAALCLFSLLSLQNERPYRFILIIIIASLFHSAAIPFLLVLFFYKGDFRKYYFPVFLISVLIALVYPFGNIIRMIPEFDILYKIQGYANNEHSEALGLLNPNIIKQGIITLICISCYSRLKEEYTDFNILFICYFISTCWLMVFNDFGIIAGRIATIFSITEVIIIPQLMLSFLKKNIWAGSILFIIIIMYSVSFYFIDLHTRDYFKPYKVGESIANLF